MRTALALILPVLLAAQGTLLDVRVVDGEGAAHTAGTRGPGLVIEVADEIGKPVSGAVVNVRLPEDGPGGTFASGFTAEILTTGADGRATTSPVRWREAIGKFQVRITAVKDRVRAGAVVSQEITEAGAVSARGVVVRRRPEPEARGHRNRWLLIGLVAVAAAGVGFAGGRSAGTKASAGQTQGKTDPIVIGSPTITITP
jgi:hypothetical protein